MLSDFIKGFFIIILAIIALGAAVWFMFILPLFIVKFMGLTGGWYIVFVLLFTGISGGIAYMVDNN